MNTKELAQKVDRILLHLEEEDHYRLDLSAHESVSLPAFPQATALNPWRNALSFATTTAAVFALLFTLTNAPAYTKIIKANLVEWTASLKAPEVEFQVPTVEAPALTSPDSDLLIALSDPTPYENRLNIEALGIHAPIVEPELGVNLLQNKNWNEFDELMNDALLEGVVHYPGTAEAGQDGNFFITGHSSNNFWEHSPFNTVFARLPEIEVGTEIQVSYEQKNYTYVVTEKKEVSPQDVSVLTQSNTPTMTLLTCTPVGTTLRRLVVTAELID